MTARKRARWAGRTHNDHVVEGGSPPVREMHGVRVDPCHDSHKQRRSNFLEVILVLPGDLVGPIRLNERAQGRRGNLEDVANGMRSGSHLTAILDCA